MTASFALLPICFLLLLSPASGSTIRQEMAAKLKSMAPKLPPLLVCRIPFVCLVLKFHSQRMVHRSSDFPVSQLNSRLSGYPAKAAAKLRMLQFGSNTKTTFEDSKIKIGPRQGVKSTYFGIAERVKDRIHLGMVSADVTAYLWPRYKIYKKKVCKRILFWKSCKDHTIKERRGYSGAEIRRIDTALQWQTIRLFTQELKHINV